jgi:altronate dehydratase large subunit
MKRIPSQSRLADIFVALYKRGGNRYGTRNHVLVIPSTFCCNSAVQKICAHFQDAAFGEHGENRVIGLPHTGGCCDVGFDESLIERTLVHTAFNPNFGGVVLVHLGCGEFCSTCRGDGAPQRNGKLIRALKKHPRIAEVVMQGPGGMRTAVKKGIAAVDRMLSAMKNESRVAARFKLGLFPASMNGSSDMTSPIANSALGSFLDQVVRDYGRAAFGQTTEMLGAENVVLERAATDKMRWRILECLTAHAEQREATEYEGVEAEPTSGNKDGGISTLSEKSLGTIKKIGSVGKIVDMVPFGKRASTKDGLHLIDTPGQDVLCLSGLAAAGCNLVLFTTGRGAPTGAAGIPTIKITANSRTYRNLKDIIDVHIPLEQVIEQGRMLDEVAFDAIADYAVAVAGGERTLAEQNEQNDFQVMKYLPTA